MSAHTMKKLAFLAFMSRLAKNAAEKRNPPPTSRRPTSRPPSGSHTRLLDTPASPSWWKRKRRDSPPINRRPVSSPPVDSDTERTTDTPPPMPWWKLVEIPPPSKINATFMLNTPEEWWPYNMRPSFYTFSNRYFPPRQLALYAYPQTAYYYSPKPIPPVSEDPHAAGIALNPESVIGAVIPTKPPYKIVGDWGVDDVKYELGRIFFRPIFNSAIDARSSELPPDLQKALDDEVRAAFGEVTTETRLRHALNDPFVQFLAERAPQFMPVFLSTFDDDIARAYAVNLQNSPRPFTGISFSKPHLARRLHPFNPLGLIAMAAHEMHHHLQPKFSPYWMPFAAVDWHDEADATMTEILAYARKLAELELWHPDPKVRREAKKIMDEAALQLPDAKVNLTWRDLFNKAVEAGVFSHTAYPKDVPTKFIDQPDWQKLWREETDTN